MESSVYGDITVILRFIEVENNINWILYCNNYSLVLFEKEVEMYNKWIKLLQRGDAPLTSYESPALADTLKITKNKDYQQFFKVPVFDQRKTVRARNLDETYKFELLDIYNLSKYKGLDKKYVSQIKEEFEYEELNLGTKDQFIDLLVMPYSSLEFKMGYRELPITHELFRNYQR